MLLPSKRPCGLGFQVIFFISTGPQVPSATSVSRCLLFRLHPPTRRQDHERLNLSQSSSTLTHRDLEAPRRRFHRPSARHPRSRQGSRKTIRPGRRLQPAHHPRLRLAPYPGYRSSWPTRVRKTTNTSANVLPVERYSVPCIPHRPPLISWPPPPPASLPGDRKS